MRNIAYGVTALLKIAGAVVISRRPGLIVFALPLWPSWGSLGPWAGTESVGTKRAPRGGRPHATFGNDAS